MHEVDEAVTTVIDSLTSTHDMTRALFALYGAHNSATTATYQLSQQMEVHVAAATAKEELAQQLTKLHAEFLHNQAKMEPVIASLAQNVKVILADYKERVDILETVDLPESP